jgi:hypothetical protein
MGVWGPPIFSDDTACDVRKDFRDAIANGLSGAAATDKILADHASDLAEPAYSATVWLALAVTQWKLGRLQARVRDAAIAAIDSGRAVAAWLGTRSESRRRDVLAKTRAQLLSPAPPPRPVGRDIACTCDWLPGDLVSYRTVGGSLIILQIQMLHTDRGGTYPSLEVLDWQGLLAPGAQVLDALPFARPTLKAAQAELDSLNRSVEATPEYALQMGRIMLLGLKPHTLNGRFEALGHRRAPPPTRWLLSGRAVLLKDFDAYIARAFGFH